LDQKAMSEEAQKIEPTLKAVEDAPSIAASIEAPIVKAPEPIAVEAPKAEPAIEAVKVEPVLAREAPTLPPAPKLERPADAPKAATPPPSFIAKGASRAAAAAAPIASAPRSTSRFPLLASSVAVAALFGAAAGAFGGAMFGHPVKETPAVALTAKETVDETKALKDQIAQLRASMKALSENVSGLKLTTGNTSAQLTKMNETLERLDRARAAAATPPKAPDDTTGSITKPQPATVQLGEPPTTLKHPVVAGWTLRRVYDGNAALIEGRDGPVEVEVGATLPGLGRIEGIKRQDGRWVVLTAKGVIVSR
jgi:hypothetical protein